MALPVGRVLDGKYKIVQVLGEGGMGTVYKVAQDVMPGLPPRYYAVKELLISPSTSKEDRDIAIERFNKEIALLEGLKNERIASLKVPFQENGNYYFVMEFVPGRSLEKILEDSKAPLPEDKVIKWGMQVCEALRYIHSQVPPIILRDLKPGNIMITTNDDVQLIDFGIARRFDSNKRTNTENLGTISYASPEHLGSITMPGQKRTAQNPGRLVQTDARSDIYSLGATLYHLLTNYEPDPIQTPPIGSIRAKNTRLRTIQVNGRTVCPIEQVIIRAMQQEPTLRFQSAEEMRIALYQCLPNSAAPQTIAIPAISSPNATLMMAANGLICPKCGFQNRPGAKFCKRDGQPLVQGVTVAPTQARPQQARSPIQARPVQRPIQARPASIQARPIQSATQTNGRSSIQARPVQRPIQARSVPTAVSAPNSDPNVAYRSALQMLSSKNYVGALQQFREAQRLGGSSYDVLYNLGRAYRQYGQSVKDTDKRLFTENMKFATEQFEDALRLKSDAVDVHFQVGLCYRDLGLYQQATNAFTKALGLAPQDPAIYYQLGLLAMDQGYYREAEARFLDGLKISPKHTLLLIATGRLYCETKQIPAAISTLRQATQEDPMLWEGWYELGRAHMKAREWHLGLSALEQARQLSPYVSDVYSAMATCYLKMNKKSEARQLVNETLQRDPTNAEALRLQKQL
ncbi:MAG: hypothetical protein NVS4B1_11420 [Ktedonobacteraceae bacterium]